MQERSPGRLMHLGTVQRPHGLAGWLRVRCAAGGAELFEGAGQLFLQRPGESEHAVRVLAARPHKHLVLLQLEGIGSRSEAEAWCGAQVLAEAQNVPREEDEFFWEELVGLRVCLADGTFLGCLTEIIPTAGHDIFVVRNGLRERLIPATHEHVLEVALERGEVVVAAGEDLLALNEI